MLTKAAFFNIQKAVQIVKICTYIKKVQNAKHFLYKKLSIYINYIENVINLRNNCLTFPLTLMSVSGTTGDKLINLTCYLYVILLS